MADMTPEKHAMPVQDPAKRATNFSEVALGYDEETARAEAARCLGCKNAPCMGGCPVGVSIPEFIAKVAEGDFIGAYEVIKRTNYLPAVCGRVCPQESQCESKCVRGIKGESVGIGRLERFCADYAAKHEKQRENSRPAPDAKRVAVVGSGPAGLTCAGALASRGFAVTVFESLHVAGGVLVYGIPEFRLPKAIVKREVEALSAAGVEFKLDSVIGKLKSVDELFKDGFEAVFISSGAGLPRFMNIEGEGTVGVYSANEYLTRVNLMKAYDESYVTPIKKSDAVAVVGGGNVAMDAARCAKRLGAKDVYIVYRRSEAEMPARKEEAEHAKEEGISFKNLVNPVRVLHDESYRVSGMECIEMELGEPDESGRRAPIEKKGSEFKMELDTVIMALGTSPNPLIRATTPALEVNKRGCIVADESMRTSMRAVWAGGDAVTGAATVILAMGAGKTAAADIADYLDTKESDRPEW